MLDLVILTKPDCFDKGVIDDMKPGAFIFVMCGNDMREIVRLGKKMDGAGFKIGFTPIFYTDKDNIRAILVGMKPLSEKTYLDQVLKNGRGVTYLDRVRIPFGKDKPSDVSRGRGLWIDFDGDYKPDEKGRFPANLICSGDSLSDGKNYKSGNVKPFRMKTVSEYNQCHVDKKTEPFFDDGGGSFSRYFDIDKIKGRFPANLICSGDALNDGIEHKGQQGAITGKEPSFNKDCELYGDYTGQGKSSVPRGDTGTFSRYFDIDKIGKLLEYLIRLGSSEGDTILIDDLLEKGGAKRGLL